MSYETMWGNILSKWHKNAPQSPWKDHGKNVQEVNFISKLIYYLQLNIAAENGLFMDDLPIYILKMVTFWFCWITNEYCVTARYYHEGGFVSDVDKTPKFGSFTPNAQKHCVPLHPLVN